MSTSFTANTLVLGNTNKDIAQAQATTQTAWQPFATFVVSLQSRQVGGETQQRTIAYFLETDRREIWPAIECNGVYELMLDQLQQVFHLEPEAVEDYTPMVESPPAAEQDPEISQSLELSLPPSASGTANLVAPPPPEERGEPPTLKITQLKIRPSPILGKDGQENAKGGETSPGQEIVIDPQRRWAGRSLRADQPLDLAITFQLQGTGALALTRQALPYHAQVYGQDRITREKPFLGRTPTGYLVEGELTYTCRLANLVLPKSESYQLQVITRLEGGSVGPDLFELSFIQVI